MKKMIVVDDCMSCPLIKDCMEWKSLSKQTKFVLTFGVGINKFILKNCKLNDYIE